MNRNGVVGLAQAVAFAMAVAAASPAPARAETLDDRIAARLAIVSETVRETHRRCHGHEAGVLALLNRIRAHVIADDAAKLDEIIRRRDPSTTFGANEAFIADEKLPVDVAAGDHAFGDGNSNGERRPCSPRASSTPMSSSTGPCQRSAPTSG